MQYFHSCGSEFCSGRPERLVKGSGRPERLVSVQDILNVHLRNARLHVQKLSDVLIQFSQSPLHCLARSRFPGKIRFAGKIGEFVTRETEGQSTVEFVELSVATKECCRGNLGSGDLNLINLWGERERWEMEQNLRQYSQRGHQDSTSCSRPL